MRRGARALRAAVPALALASLSSASPARAQEAGWRIHEAGVPGRSLTALAAHERSGLLALGDAHGVQTLAADGRSRGLLRRGPVQDLLFFEPGPGPVEPLLLAATLRGLYRIDAGGRVEPAHLGPGGASRSVQRLVGAPGLVAAAGDDGVFVSADGLHWQRLPGLPAGPARAVALRAVPGGWSCFSGAGEELWHSFVTAAGVGGSPAPSSASFAAVSRRMDPGSGAEGEIVDLAAEIPGLPLVAVHERSLRAQARDGRWETLRPALPPGATLRRLVSAHGSLWLASDRGLARAGALSGPWQAATGPAAHADIAALAAAGGRLYAASSSGLLVGGPAPPTAASSAPAPLRSGQGEPGIAEVQRAAIAYLGLRREGILALERGLQRRGWLPVLSLRAGYERDENEHRGRDQTFSSGAIRDLRADDGEGGHQFDVSLVATWDLGDIAYHPEAIDVAKEARERIELRDDVLDELNQLYFERRRVLSELAQDPDPASASALRLRLRADELAAGIDGWTGGWFSRRVAPPAPGSPSPGPEPRNLP